ncbi:MAG: phospholipase [Acidobacteria bacterium]|nr:MAG: phospholipase [Acidobacteriota bacterium]PYQ91727.1 MAG: phospholipase [Acidobacteriota bacterium]PYR09564.1 MAG: phospholipase [Acidobacteriota bacterium]
MIARTIATATHGRYLVVPPAADGPAPLLVGFHGYAEHAEQQLARLQAIPGSNRWLLVSVQGLNRFYQRRTNEVVAGWMTRQDRDLAIADNLAYVSNVVDAVAREWRAADTLVFTGFSQGVATAFRAAASSPRAVSGIIAAGGDVPPEIDAASLRRINAALICRGARDDWYTAEKFAADDDRIRSAGVRPRSLEVDAGHEWSDAIARAAGEFLRELWS